MAIGTYDLSNGGGVFVSQSVATNSHAKLSVVGWFRRTQAVSGGKRLLGKESGSILRGWMIAAHSATANIRMVFRRATTNLNYVSTNNVFADTDWKFLAVTWDHSGSNTNRIKLFVGDVTSSVTASPTTVVTEGSGVYTMDTNNDKFVLFNYGAASLQDSTGAFECAWVQHYNRVLSHNEIRTLQFNPRPLDSGCTMFLTAEEGVPVSDYSGKGIGAVSSSLVHYVPGPPIRSAFE